MDQHCVIEDVFRVLKFIRKDHRNTIHEIMCIFVLDISSEDGTNGEIERTFNTWSRAETVHNNKLDCSVRDKQGFVSNSIHFRERSKEYNAFLSELELQR